MATEVVGVHELGLGGNGLTVDELQHVDLGLLGLGRRLARLQGAAERAGQAVGGVHAPGLAGEDGLLVVLGDVHPGEDLVHDVGHRADRHREVDDAGRAVHAAVATHGLAADERLVRRDRVDELPHRCLELRILLVHDLEDRRRLVVLDERVVLGTHRVGERGHDVVVGVHRLARAGR